MSIAETVAFEKRKVVWPSMASCRASLMELRSFGERVMVITTELSVETALSVSWTSIEMAERDGLFWMPSSLACTLTAIIVSEKRKTRVPESISNVKRYRTGAATSATNVVTGVAVSSAPSALIKFPLKSCTNASVKERKVSL